MTVHPPLTLPYYSTRLWLASSTTSWVSTIRFRRSTGTRPNTGSPGNCKKVSGRMSMQIIFLFPSFCLYSPQLEEKWQRRRLKNCLDLAPTRFCKTWDHTSTERRRKRRWGGLKWHWIKLFPQDLVDTAQKRQALNEVEARHKEIMQLEANIRVSPIPIHTFHYFMVQTCGK